MVEASLVWVRVFRSRGRFTSSGSVKLTGACWAWIGRSAWVVGAAWAAAWVAGGAWVARFAWLVEHDASSTADRAATRERSIPMISAPLHDEVGKCGRPRPHAQTPIDTPCTPSWHKPVHLP